MYLINELSCFQKHFSLSGKISKIYNYVDISDNVIMDKKKIQSQQYKLSKINKYFL